MTTAVEMHEVVVRFELADVLREVNWTVGAHDRWVVIGGNGAGKSTLLRLAALTLHPTSGDLTVFGNRLGRCDVRKVRTRIATSSPALAAAMAPTMTAIEVVMTAKHAALAPWWHRYDAADRDRADGLLDRFGVRTVADQPFATLSAGERQRTLLARTLMRDPELVLLDEPTAGLDIGAREQVLGDLTSLAHTRDAAPVVLVTHHLEEIPAGFTHALVLRNGGIVASGPIGETLTSEIVSECFAVSLTVQRSTNRYTARLT